MVDFLDFLISDEIEKEPIAEEVETENQTADQVEQNIEIKPTNSESAFETPTKVALNVECNSSVPRSTRRAKANLESTMTTSKQTIEPEPNQKEIVASTLTKAEPATKLSESVTTPIDRSIQRKSLESKSATSLQIPKEMEASFASKTPCKTDCIADEPIESAKLAQTSNSSATPSLKRKGMNVGLETPTAKRSLRNMNTPQSMPCATETIKDAENFESEQHILVQQVPAQSPELQHNDSNGNSVSIRTFDSNSQSSKTMQASESSTREVESSNTIQISNTN